MCLLALILLVSRMRQIRVFLNDGSVKVHENSEMLVYSLQYTELGVSSSKLE